MKTSQQLNNGALGQSDKCSWKPWLQVATKVEEKRKELHGSTGPAPHTLTLFQTKIADFPTLFKTFNPKPKKEHTRRLFIVQEKIPCLRQKLIKSIPCQTKIP